MSPVIFPPGRAKLSMSPRRDRILNCHHDNRNRLCRLLGREDPSCSLGDKDIDLELHQFGHEAWDTVRLSLRRAKLKHDVFPLNITEIPQPLPECLKVR